MDHDLPTTVLHWNYRGFTEFPIQKLEGDENQVTDIYLKENLISHIPRDISKLIHLESLYLSGNDITVLPKEIGNLRCLKCLDLSGNRLRNIPEEIGDVRALKFLILDENELSELPLRLAELKFLRYLSVCDNQLKWLPQRPVYNYFHCEFRFWRNPTLKTIPYSLWFHMFRGQQTRSLNIGCLSIPKENYTSKGKRCRLQMVKDSTEGTVDIQCPPHDIILNANRYYPASLFELAKRKFYQMLLKTAKSLSNDTSNVYYNYYEDKIYNDNNNNTNSEYNNNGYDLNGNNLDTACEVTYNNFTRSKRCYVPADIITEYFSFLPYFIKEEFCGGPVSTCENVNCKMPVFDYAFYEFCVGEIILIDNKAEVILSAVFCSKTCSDTWKRGKTNLLFWVLVEETWKSF